MMQPPKLLELPLPIHQRIFIYLFCFAAGCLLAHHDCASSQLAQMVEQCPGPECGVSHIMAICRLAFKLGPGIFFASFGFYSFIYCLGYREAMERVRKERSVASKDRP